jgi:ATP-dependent Lon protease
VEAAARARIVEFLQEEPYIQVRVELVPETEAAGAEPRVQEIVGRLRELQRSWNLPDEAFRPFEGEAPVDPGRFADLVTPFLPISVEAQQQILDTLPPRDRLERVMHLTGSARVECENDVSQALPDRCL